MPELPEVETTRLGIKPHLEGNTIQEVIIRQPKLRWPIPQNLPTLLKKQKITSVARRGKYLLITAETGTVILHLGMSGHLRCLPTAAQPQKHDHVDILLSNGICLRFHDPRRFGAILWTQDDPLNHPLLKSLGPEPLSECFTGSCLHQRSRNRCTPVKLFIMDPKVVVGVGNIYANEALFKVLIHPGQKANQISEGRYQMLAKSIKSVLKSAIEQGGTTLKNFLDEKGQPGYFKQQLAVYGRSGKSCQNCGLGLKGIRLAGRATVYCSHCQR